MARIIIRDTRKLYGKVPAIEFGPKSLKAVGQVWLDRGQARRTINKNMRRLTRIFKWAASEELIPVTIYQALATVPGLKLGRTTAHEGYNNERCLLCQAFWVCERLRLDSINMIETLEVSVRATSSANAFTIFDKFQFFARRLLDLAPSSDSEPEFESNTLSPNGPNEDNMADALALVARLTGHHYPHPVPE